MSGELREKGGELLARPGELRERVRELLARSGELREKVGEHLACLGDLRENVCELLARPGELREKVGEVLAGHFQALAGFSEGRPACQELASLSSPTFRSLVAIQNGQIGCSAILAIEAED